MSTALAASPVSALTESAFEGIRRVLARETGIWLSPAKRHLVACRLGSHLNRLGMPDFDAYSRLVAGQGAHAERACMVDLLTTHETYFFREPAHFTHFADEVLPLYGSAPLRVWSAATSSGEEAYSLAMCLASRRGGQPWEVVGTDVSAQVVASAERGLYGMERLQCMPKAMLRQYCLRGTGEFAGQMLINRDLRQNTRFRCHNLLESAAELGVFDVIFLRNVLIYFEAEARQQMLDQVLAALRPGGWLYIGHADSLHGVAHGLRLHRPSVFRQPLPLDDGEA